MQAQFANLWVLAMCSLPDWLHVDPLNIKDWSLVGSSLSSISFLNMLLINSRNNPCCICLHLEHYPGFLFRDKIACLCLPASEHPILLVCSTLLFTWHSGWSPQANTEQIPTLPNRGLLKPSILPWFTGCLTPINFLHTDVFGSRSKALKAVESCLLRLDVHTRYIGSGGHWRYGLQLPQVQILVLTNMAHWTQIYRFPTCSVHICSSHFVT